MVDDVSHRYDKVLNGFVFEGPDNFSLSIKGSKNLGYLFRESHLWNILNLIHLKVVNCLRIFQDFLLFFASWKCCLGLCCEYCGFLLSVHHLRLKGDPIPLADHLTLAGHRLDPKHLLLFLQIYPSSVNCFIDFLSPEAAGPLFS